MGTPTGIVDSFLLINIHMNYTLRDLRTNGLPVLLKGLIILFLRKPPLYFHHIMMVSGILGITHIGQKLAMGFATKLQIGQVEKGFLGFLVIRVKIFRSSL